jgi:very-short-patch-repair endonuclease
MKRGQRDAPPPLELFQELKPRVRDLRHEATPAEAKLWAAIKDGKLGFRFEKQSRRERFLDFFCPEANLAVEIEGHVRTPAEDEMRLAGLGARGVRLLRFSNDDVLKHLPHVLKVLKQALESAVQLDAHQASV